MITPAFSLDFTSAVLDPRITFARSGATATRVNASGYIETVAADTARFDYNPVTLACKGLLIEESRTNLSRYSQDLTNPYWNKQNVTITGTVTSPSGTNTGQTITASAGSAAHDVVTSSAYISTAAGTYTTSWYVKAGTANFVTIGVTYTSVSWAMATFDLSSPTAATKTASGAGAGVLYVSSSITAGKDGWYRMTFVWTASDASIGLPMLQINSSSTPTYGSFGVETWNAVGTETIHAWGVQSEQGSFATSYIPTTSAALTRNADVVTVTGANFSDWWQAGLGGATVQALPSTVSGVRPLIQFDDGTANEIIALRGNTTNPELYIVDGGTLQAQIDAGTIAANTAYRLTGWWQTNFCAARKDNGARVEDLTATIPTVTQARLGSDGTNYLNGHLASINYYDQFSGQIYTRRKNKVVFTVI